ncbi:MAG TPA: hypothetical protein IGS52_22825 [Oscillatoriaceae cyanobacterium M33_DOE_052]|uniref:Uncharacterized protein n=1 Tax=Planktothricoides sp. SpSt-374 TaxID=2282167 RepID=A0A7C3ZKU5_9CYAN|nr:hypothetical protein [Oscillatoriaceae cyanobacterium M33_DOE_052]
MRKPPLSVLQGQLIFDSPPVPGMRLPDDLGCHQPIFLSIGQPRVSARYIYPSARTSELVRNQFTAFRVPVNPLLASNLK